MKTLNNFFRTTIFLTVLFLFIASACVTAASAGELIRNGDFSQEMAHWNVSPKITPVWNPLDNGAVNLHPPGGIFEGFTGTVIYQNLNVTSIANETLSFSMDLYKTSPYLTGGPTIMVELAYTTGAPGEETLSFLEVALPENKDISDNPNAPTIVTREVMFPADAMKLVKLSIIKDDHGELIADNINLASGTAVAGFIPVITGISAVEGDYGTQIEITGSNFEIGGAQSLRLISMGGSSDGVVINTWTDTKITATVNDPARSGRFYVVSDFVESDLTHAFHITSPNYTVDLKKDDITVVKGQVAEYLVRVDFHNDFETAEGITFSIDPETLPPGAVVSFTPVPLKNDGGVLLKIDTADVDPGDYLVILKAEEGETQPRFVPFLLEVVTIEEIQFFKYINQGQDFEEVTSVALTTQGPFNTYLDPRFDIRAVDSEGNVWFTVDVHATGSGSPLTISSSDPSVVQVYQHVWGADYYAVGIGTADIVVTASDGSENRLPVNVIVADGDPKINQISISPQEVHHNYTGDITFSAEGTSDLAVVFYVNEMWMFESTFSEKLSGHGPARSSVFTLQGQAPELGTVFFSASVQEESKQASSIAALRLVPDPGMAQLMGGVRQLDDFGETFLLEFYDSEGEKSYERDLSMNHQVNFHLAGIPTGTWRLKLTYWDWFHGTEYSLWYPNGETFDDAEPLEFTAGTAVDDIYFLLKKGPGIAFTGRVVASDVEGMNDGTPIEGARVSWVDDPGIATVTDGNGYFRLSGLPPGAPFTLQITHNDYVTLYSSTIVSDEDVPGLWPFVMFTEAELSGWLLNADSVWDLDTGMITGRVVNAANPAETVAGVSIGYWSPPPPAEYDVAYFDGNSFYFGDGATTAENGLYYIFGVEAGGGVVVQAAKEGWTFQGPAFHTTYSGAVHQGLVLGSALLRPGMLYMRFSDGYQLEFMLQGDVSDIVSVTVTGPGVTNFSLTEDDGEFWAVYPSQTTFIEEVDFPGYPGTYTFTATYGDSTTDTFTFDFQPGTPTPMAVPTGLAVDENTGMLSWEPVTGATGYYLIIFSGEYGVNYEELFHGEDYPLIPLDDTSFNLFALMAGRGADPGGYYAVRVVAVDGFGDLGNEAYSDPEEFTYTPPAHALLGTWGLAMLTHEYDAPSAAWYTEQSRVTFNPGGSGLLAGIRNDGAEEEANRIEAIDFAFTYTITPNSDGSFSLAMTVGDEQWTNRVILSDDGSMALMDGTAAPGEVSIGVLVRIDPEKTYDPTLAGRYYYQGFQYSEDDLEDPPDGFGRYMALSGVHEFFDTAEGGLYRTDDLGAWCNSVKTDGSNTIWYDPGEQYQTYNISDGGGISMGHDEDGSGFFRGALAGNGSVFAGTGSYGSNDWMSYLFMKQGDRHYSNADLNGKWAVVGFGQENEPSEDMFFMAEIGTMTCYGNEFCDFKFRERASDGFLGVEEGSIALTVAADGSIGGWLVGSLPSVSNQPSTLIGAIGNDGNTLMLNASFDSAERREVFIAVRASAIGDLAGSAFQSDVIYMGYSGGYRLEFQLEGDMSDVDTVKVSGPTGSGIVDFMLDREVGESWNVYPSEADFLGGSFPEDYRGSYTFTVTYVDQSTEEVGFNFQPPADPMAVPSGIAVNEASGELSWNAVTGAAGYYLIIFSGDYGQSYVELYHGEDDPPIQGTSVNLFALMAGIQADPGDYRVRVVAVDGPLGNEAYADPVFFTYTAPNTVSFSGWVRNNTQDHLAVTGAQVEVWKLSSVEGVPAPTLISTAAADGDAGAFSLTGLPTGPENMLYLKIPQPAATNYAPVLSRYMILGDDVQALLPYRLFTAAEYAALENVSGKGMILGRVVMRDNPSQPLPGATITVQRWTPDQLHPDQFYTEVTSDQDGLYIVNDVPLTDDLSQYVLYQVTASLDGYTFHSPCLLGGNNSVVPVAAGTITQESFFATETAFQPDVIYMGYSGGYRLEFQLEGDMSDVDTVKVSGPTGSGIVDFMLDREVGESWNVYPSEADFLGGSFPEDYRGSYTFTVTYVDQSTEEVGFNFQPPALPMAVPTGVAVDGNTGMLSWSAVTGAAGYYLIIFSGEYGQSYLELYHGEDDPPIQATTFNLFAFMAGLEATPGDYRVRVVAVDGLPGNEAYGDPAVFSYQVPDLIPGLDQAIRALKVVAGENNVDVADIRDVNNDGKIGLAEALFVLQANPGLREPLPPVTSVSGTASLISRDREDPTPFDGFQFSTQTVVDMDSGDFFVEHNIISLWPGVTALDLGTVPLEQVTEVSVTGYGDEDNLPDELEGSTIAFRLADGTYAVIQFTEVAVDAGNVTTRSSFNYKWQPDGTPYF
jgi:hypothetical protein